VQRTARPALTPVERRESPFAVIPATAGIQFV
jgi:hypothetical protein